METYSYVDDQDEHTEIESIHDRIMFLLYEWTLILSWIATLLLVWRVTFVALIEHFLPIHTIRLAIIVVALGLMIASAYALTMTGRWLRKRPRTQPLMHRWAQNLGTVALFTILGRIIVWFFVDGKS